MRVREVPEPAACITGMQAGRGRHALTRPLARSPAVQAAIGDLHGDAVATRRALRLAGVLHPQRDAWTGGQTVVVQVGDQLDRGDDELEVLNLLHRLSQQATAAGGALHVLCGNHEMMAANGYLYVHTYMSM